MFLNTPLSHKLSIYFYNTDVCRNPSDYRSSRPEVFCKKGVFRNFTKFTGKHHCQSLCNFIKKETLALVFYFEFCEICKITFFIEHLWWLPL